jgi:O-antigen/teichoic acid export membrane protein
VNPPDAPRVDAERATTGVSVVRGGIWSAASSVGPQFFTLAISIAAARFLGASGLGRQSFIAFSIATAINVAGTGLQVALMRAVGESVGAGRAADARGLAAWASRVITVPACAVLAALLATAVAGAKPMTAWILAAAIAALGVLTDAPGGALAGLQRWRDLSLTILGCSGAGAVATIAVLAAGGGITGMFAVQLAVSCAILAAVALLARRRLHAIAPISSPPGRAARVDTLRYAGSALVGALVTLVVFRRSELFFLQHWADDREIAIYSVAFSGMTTLVLAPQALASVLSPAVATLHGAGRRDRIRTGYSRALRMLLFVSLPLTAGALALGPETIRLVFGPQFSASRVPLLVLLAPVPLIPLMNASYSLIVGLGNARFPLLAGAASALLNISLDVLLIPDRGAIGAAIANACAQGVTAIATILYGIRLAGGVAWYAAPLFRLGAAAAVGGGAAWLALTLVGGAPGVFSGLLADLGVFGAGALILRILPCDDAAWIERSFGHVFDGRVAAAAVRIAARDARAHA